jgi:DNA-binding CsgD family transcriptional regulator
MDHALKRSLPPSQTEIISLLAEGLPNKIIAHRLGISQSAVEKRIQAMRIRLDLPDKRSVERHCRALMHGEKRSLPTNYCFSELQFEAGIHQHHAHDDTSAEFWTNWDRAIIFIAAASAVSHLLVGAQTVLSLFRI